MEKPKDQTKPNIPLPSCSELTIAPLYKGRIVSLEKASCSLSDLSPLYL